MRGFSIVLLVILGAIGAGVGIESTQLLSPIKGPFDSFGSFAGYDWSGDITSLSAQFQVPTIAPRSPTGEAATWIGVQSDNDDRFIQVGVLESTLAPAVRGGRYAVFWSGAAQRFEPQFLPGSVRGGDEVDVSMRTITGGWLLSFSDLTHRWHTAFATATDPQYGYDVAEWLQEDPTKLLGKGGPEPYPTLSEVSFSHLRVDGHRPQLSLDNARWMSERGETLAPSAVQAGTFTVQPRLLDRPQEQYLAAILPINEATTALDDEEQVWGPQTSSNLLASEQALRYANAVNRFDRIIGGESWPAAALVPLRIFRRALDGTVKDAEAWAATESPPRVQQLQQASNIEELLSNTFALEVRSALGLAAPD